MAFTFQKEIKVDQNFMKPPYLYVWELAKIGVHSQQCLIYQFLMEVCPKQVIILEQNKSNVGRVGLSVHYAGQVHLCEQKYDNSEIHFIPSTSKLIHKTNRV